MKKYILLCFILIFTLSFSIFANAETSEEEKNYLDSVFEVGDDVYYTCEITYIYRGTEYHWAMDMRTTITESNKMMCLYYEPYSLSSTGQKLCEIGTPAGTEILYKDLKSDGTEYTNQSCVNVQPIKYMDTSIYESCSDVYFLTNLPIFSSYEDAISYRNGDLGIENAVNYNKVWNNGNWVSPFEDLEINDSDIVLPVLSNITHEGFTVDNIDTDARFLLEIYMQSGIETPANYVDGTHNISDALFVNNFGLINENSEAYYHNSVVDLNMMYSVDNNTALLSSINSFYTTYPSCYDYTKGVDRVWKASELYNIWGLPFGKQAVFFNHNTKVSASELAKITPYDIPNAYTQYKVRFFYFDDSSGWHYGPWASYTYFSDGNVVKSGIFQNNNGDIIETPTENGKQDTSGNISYSNNAEYINLNNPNELFSYIRATINNIDLSMGNFATLFATVFGFIPVEIQSMLWLGIAVMVIVGVIKVIKG
ncbi:MAG: hypothetical protein J6A73_08490 [Lachnospiraceae bacterium]|nr:hypothetical protein [Lachnospiraceae bacterium]